MKKFLRENGLSVAFFVFFVLCLAGQAFSGHRAYNDEREAAKLPPVSLRAYLGTGHFGESVFENWESEFLQIGLFVFLTIFLRQKGSSESKSLEPQSETPYKTRNAPWPVKRGGVALKLYEHSLTLSLLLLFLGSWVLHAVTGLRHYNEEQMQMGQPAVNMAGYVLGAQFWFESMQNWQSEFLSVAVLIVLSIYLREKGSSQSKPVDATYAKTGD